MPLPQPISTPAPTEISTAVTGRVELICGNMFAGKTSLLIRKLQAAARSGQRTVAVTHARDTRFGGGRLATHDGQVHTARAIHAAHDLPSLVEGAQLLVVDEAQFFDPPIAGIVRKLVEEKAVTVWLAGIEFDIWGRAFETVQELKLVADGVHIQRSTCAVCDAVAPFTQRLTPIRSGNLIGGRGDFEPRCGDCFQPWPEG